MRHRYIIITFVLLSSVIRMSAQALSERYTNARPVVVVSDDNTPPYSFTDDNGEAAHNLQQGYEAILDNPFVAISFYDNNGKLIIQNDTMKRLGTPAMPGNRQPLYNLKGEIANYFVAFRSPLTPSA